MLKQWENHHVLCVTHASASPPPLVWIKLLLTLKLSLPVRMSLLLCIVPTSPWASCVVSGTPVLPLVGQTSSQPEPQLRCCRLSSLPTWQGF